MLSIQVPSHTYLSQACCETMPSQELAPNIGCPISMLPFVYINIKHYIRYLQCFILGGEVDSDHEEDQDCDRDVDDAEVVDAQELHTHEFILWDLNLS